MPKTFIPSNYEDKVDRALHNLYCERRTTLNPFQIIPIYWRRLFKGDVFDFQIVESLLQSEPTYAPLMGNWKIHFEWYFDSDANRYGWLDNNSRLTAEEIMQRKHHTFNLFVDSSFGQDGDEFGYPGDIDNVVNGRGNVHQYCGIPSGFMINPYDIYDLNLDVHLTYLNIIRNYHCNRQYPDVPYISEFNPLDADTTSIHYYSAKNMDDLFVMLRSCPNGVNIDAILGGNNERSDIPDWLADHYQSAITAFTNWLYDSQHNYSGLFCAQYEPDIYQNLLAKDQGLLHSTVVVNNGSISIETFRLQNHLQHLYDDIYVSGGRNRDLSRTRWGVKSNRDYDIPELICSYSEIIGNNLITSNNSGMNTKDNTESSPGSMSGNLNRRFNGSTKQKFKANEGGILMCLVYLVPLVDYDQGMPRFLLNNYFEDEFSPQMARKGFESIPQSDYCAIPDYYVDYYNTEYRFVSDHQPLDVVGRQVAWLYEMSDVNRVFGEFSYDGTQRDWVLRRNFLYDERVQDDSQEIDQRNVSFFGFSPYGSPFAFQYPFITQGLMPNFYLQVGFNVSAYRPIGRRFMPTLGQ